MLNADGDQSDPVGEAAVAQGAESAVLGNGGPAYATWLLYSRSPP